MSEQLIGSVSHFYAKPSVAAVILTAGELAVGDTIHVVGHTSDFVTEVTSLQIEHEAVASAKAGDHVGIQVGTKARTNDQVYRVVPD